MASSPRLMDRPKSKNFHVLIRLFSFLAPYKPRVLLAFVALITTVGATLGLGQGLKQLIDAGFTAQNPQALDNALVFLLILAVVMAAGTFLRFFMVSGLGNGLLPIFAKRSFNAFCPYIVRFLKLLVQGKFCHA